jgi:hypothetical protein
MALTTFLVFHGCYQAAMPKWPVNTGLFNGQQFFHATFKYYEVIRFDSAHGCPHKDILDPTGSVVRKVWFELLDNQQGLNLAIKDLKDNYELYIERFKKWLKE